MYCSMKFVGGGSMVNISSFGAFLSLIGTAQDLLWYYATFLIGLIMIILVFINPVC